MEPPPVDIIEFEVVDVCSKTFVGEGAQHNHPPLGEEFFLVDGFEYALGPKGPDSSLKDIASLETSPPG